MFCLESIRFHSVTCSCIFELREAVTVSWIFPPELGIFADFLKRGAAKLFGGGCAQRMGAW